MQGLIRDREQSLRRKNIHSKSEEVPDLHLERLVAVRTQSFLYVAALFIPSIPTVVCVVLEQGSEPFFLLVLQRASLPISGFFNYLVYVRPSYLKARREFPTESRLWAWKRALYGDKVQPTDEPVVVVEESYRNQCDASSEKKIHPQNIDDILLLVEMNREEIPSKQQNESTNLSSRIGDHNCRSGEENMTRNPTTDDNNTTAWKETATIVLRRWFISSLHADESALEQPPQQHMATTPVGGGDDQKEKEKASSTIGQTPKTPNISKKNSSTNNCFRLPNQSFIEAMEGEKEHVQSMLTSKFPSQIEHETKNVKIGSGSSSVSSVTMPCIPEALPKYPSLGALLED